MKYWPLSIWGTGTVSLPFCVPNKSYFGNVKQSFEYLFHPAAVRVSNLYRQTLKRVHLPLRVERVPTLCLSVGVTNLKCPQFLLAALSGQAKILYGHKS